MLLRSFRVAAASALLLTIASTSKADSVSFDMQAYPKESAHLGTRCLSHWIPKGTFVRGSVTASPGLNQIVSVEIYDKNDYQHNQYFQKSPVTDTKFSFTTSAHSDVEVCLKNIMADGFPVDTTSKRSVRLVFDFGAEATDFADLAKKEKLKPMEVELRKLEKLVEEIVDEMDYLKRREAKMRDTNESTNERVWSFSALSIIVLVSVGAWQVYYLRKFFQSKKLI